jgi:MoaA/NifB/PqqE/SkfB family radical SAM enzyme
VGNVLYLSIPFTWLLPEAREVAAVARSKERKVVAGGPAVQLMPDYLNGAAEMPGECPYPTLEMHNPLATFTTRGCPRRCSFCAVPRLEGAFRELTDWPVRPVICDNNLLEATQAHFDRVIDRLKKADFPAVDFNQGLDARLFNGHHAGRLAELKGAHVRFALDHVRYETPVVEAIKLAQKAGLKKITVYVLCGYKDTHDDALDRVKLIQGLGAMPFPMRYQPLDALRKNSYVGANWVPEQLADFTRYWGRLNYLKWFPYDEFEYTFHADQTELFPKKTEHRGVWRKKAGITG